MNINVEQLESIDDLLMRIRRDIDNAYLVLSMNDNLSEVKRNQVQYFLETAIANCKALEKMVLLVGSKRLA